MRRVLAMSMLALGLPFAGHAQTPAPAPATVRLNAGEAASSSAGRSATDLAKQLQNPVSDLYSVPFQSNTNLRVGPQRGTQEILNIQPVIPIHLNDDWNIITRTILPLVWNPSLAPAQSVPFGTGPTVFTAFLSPSRPRDGWLWGIGPVIQVPTASDASLGSAVWGGGLSGALVLTRGPWVVGGLVNNIWSFGGSSGPTGTRYNTLTVQPFVNYNFGEGRYIGTSPIITADWLSPGNSAWTLPIGGMVGQVIKLGGKLPVNLSLGAYYNALRPDYGPTWQIRTQVTFIF